MNKNSFVNDVENITAPSNRRLSVKDFDTLINLGWSIDRISIVGELNDKVLYTNDNGFHVIDFEMFMNLNTGKGFLEKVGENGWQLLDSHRENIAYISILKYQEGMGRIEFNPNKISHFITGSLKYFIHLLFLNPHFSRADVACDIVNVPDDLINQYQFIEPVSINTFRDKKGKLETKYWGRRSSEKQIRLYDKKTERRSKNKKLPKGVDTWWRLETQLRRSKSSNWESVINETLKNFVSPFFIPSHISGTDKVMIKGLLSDEECWNYISRPSKYKYRKMIKECGKSDELTKIIIDTFHENADNLRNELDDWLRGIRVDEE